MDGWKTRPFPFRMAYFSGCYVMLNFQGVHLSRVLFLPHVDEVFLRLPLTWPDICWEIMWLASNLWVSSHLHGDVYRFPPWKRMVWNYRIHPGRLTWNLRIHQYTPGRGKSSSKPSFPGSMLIFRGVSPFLPLKIPPKFLPARWINLTFFCCWKLMWMGSSVISAIC